MNGGTASEQEDPARPLSMRQAYKNRLMALLEGDPRIICLDSDTGTFGRADAEAAGEQYIDLGIAEHSLMGVAAGLAASGRVPFVNTMATFAATRALEAVKIDIAYTNLPVRVIATHGGLSAGHLGPTHQALEDLAIMRTLPNMTVVVPADAASTEAAIEQCVRVDGPVYVRLGRKPTPPLPDGPPTVLGQAQVLREGTDVVLACCGPHPVLACLEAADALAREGVSAAVLNFHTLRPFDTATLLWATADASLVVTVEEHWASGGLGGAVCEVLAEARPTRVLRVGMPDAFVNVVGNHEHLLKHYGITASSVLQAVQNGLKPAPFRKS